MNHDKGFKKTTSQRLAALWALLICLSVFGPGHLAQGAVLLQSGQPLADLSGQIQYLEDRTHQVQIKQLLDPKTRPKLTSVTSTEQSFGYNEAAFWFTFELRNQADLRTWWLVMGPSWNFQMDLYLVEQGKIIRQQSLGKNFPYSQRPIDHEKFVFPLEFPLNQDVQVWIRVVSPNMALDLTLAHPETYLLQDRETRLVNGMFYGLVSIIAVFNLMIYLRLRTRVYLYYCASLIFIMLAQAGLDGITYQWLWPNSPVWASFANLVFTAAFLIAEVLFAIQFLDIKERHPKLYRFLQFEIAFFALNFVIPLSESYRSAPAYGSFTSLCGLIFTVTMFFVGLYAYLKGNKAARFFLLAYAGYISTIILWISRQAGLLPAMDIFQYLLKMGSAFEITFLAIALADSISLIRTERNQAIKATLETERNFAKQLEAQVQTRTQELAQANETKNKFFSIISHDLRGPIGSLSVIFNEVAHKGPDIDTGLFQSIRNSTKNTHQLLENLLTWANSQQGEISYHPHTFSIDLPLQASLDLYAGNAAQKGITLKGEWEPGLFAYADQEMVTTIIRNLVNNALKFTSTEGEITVSCQPEAGWLKVKVQDSGVGIDPETQATLFRLDQKAHSSLGTNREAGSGLGLILCSEFINKHGGEIGVESQEGQGSCFWFTLPIGNEAEAISQESTEAMYQQLAAMKTLVVDDNPLHLQSTVSVLKELALVYETAANGYEAVQKAKTGQFDLILMDIDMPDLNGVEANLAIRRSPEKTPLILALTSYSAKELENMAKEAPFDGYLNKPLDKAKLLSSLQPHLQHC